MCIYSHGKMTRCLSGIFYYYSVDYDMPTMCLFLDFSSFYALIYSFTCYIP